jgi:hypothetical protein
MKRLLGVLVAAAACLWLSAAVVGQGINFFSKPNIADIFKPVVGSGAAYEQQSTDQKRPASQLEMTVVGKEMTPNGEGYWMEVGHMDPKGGAMMYTKMLVTKDFQFTKIVMKWQSGSRWERKPSRSLREHSAARIGKRMMGLTKCARATR